LLKVVSVQGRRGIRRFVRVPWTIYSEDPNWIPPLLLERQEHLSRRNPYFAHARHRLWIAYRGSRPVGRISAQVDELHLKRYHDATGFFGMIEGEDDPEVFHRLFGAAESWLRKEGMHRILGPFNLSINQECGLLVEGFDTPPSVMMGHALPYYGERIEEQGYSPEKDLLAYTVDNTVTLSKTMRAVVRRAERRVNIRPLRRSHFGEELRILQDVFEDAWSQNWGFVPFTGAEFAHLGQNLKYLVDDDLIQIAEVDGRPAAMIVTLPNVNEVIRDLNGRLFPLGWLKVLWRLKVAYPKTARVALMGVCRAYQDSLLGAALACMVIEAVRVAGVKRGIQRGELSWILEDNTGMRNIIESLGGVAYKRYRIYGRELSPRGVNGFAGNSGLDQ
jgi:hypothetical protein